MVKRQLNSIDDEKLIALRALSFYARDLLKEEDYTNLESVLALINIYAHEVE